VNGAARPAAPQHAGGPGERSFEDALVERIGLAARRWLPDATVESWEAVTKGSSSLTFAVVLGNGGAAGGPDRVPAYVKVAPPGLEPVRNRDVLRQAAVIDQLYRAGSVPVARVLFDDPGSPPEVPPFFVAEAVSGSCFEPLVDDAALPDAAVLTARSEDAARVLARLHRFDPAALRGRGLAGTEAQVDLAGEVDRWGRIFATLRRGSDEDTQGAASAEEALVRQAQTCAERLHSALPRPHDAVVVHGDFRLGNLVCDDAGVRAILDWEIWSLSDPRIDVAWLLMTLSSDGLPSVVRSEAPGLLSVDEVVKVYEQAGGAPLSDLSWFAALSRFRAAAAMALNVKHNRRRPEPNPRIESYAQRLPTFLSVATDMLA
jgi:aminoglycoside phosphotransferase (APT) family kinase protein